MSIPALVLLTLQASKPIAIISFRFIRNEVVAQARIQGKGPFNVLLDTGTAPSVLDLKLARRLHLKTQGSGLGDGGGTHPQTTFELSIPSVRLAGLQVHNLAALATDLSGLSKTFGTRIDAVLGDSLFAGRVVQFDYGHRVVRFFAAMPSPDRQSLVLPFQHENNEVHLTSGVRINGQDVVGNLDTGSSSRFSITTQGIKNLQIEDFVARARSSHSAGFSGSYSNKTGTVDSVEVGRFRVENPTVGFWTAGTGHDTNPWDVNIGNAFLKDYVVTLDYVTNRVVLTPE